MVLVLIPVSAAASPLTIVAHRGDTSVAPENTLPAFRAAAARGATNELDVHMTRDGVAVVIHDPTVNRTTDSIGAVSEMTLTEVGDVTIDVGRNAAALGSSIPTLQDALITIRGAHPTSKVLIELKFVPTEVTALAVAGDVQDTAMQSRVVFGSFASDSVNTIRAAAQDLGWTPKVGLYLGGVRSPAELSLLNLAWVMPDYSLATVAYVAALHSKGFVVYPYTANDGRAWDRVRASGADGALTDQMGLMRAWDRWRVSHATRSTRVVTTRRLP